MDRRCEILVAAYRVAERDGWDGITREKVATIAGCALGSIPYYFNNMGELKDEVMRRAVQLGNITIVAAGLAAGNKYAKGAPEALKREALNTLM